MNRDLSAQFQREQLHGAAQEGDFARVAKMPAEVRGAMTSGPRWGRKGWQRRFRGETMR